MELSNVHFDLQDKLVTCELYFDPMSVPGAPTDLWPLKTKNRTDVAIGRALSVRFKRQWIAHGGQGRFDLTFAFREERGKLINMMDHDVIHEAVRAFNNLGRGDTFEERVTTIDDGRAVEAAEQYIRNRVSDWLVGAREAAEYKYRHMGLGSEDARIKAQTIIKDLHVEIEHG